MTAYRCMVCEAEGSRYFLRPTIDEKYAQGRCIHCKADRLFRATAAQEPPGATLALQGMEAAAANASQGVDAAWQQAAEQVALELAHSGRDFTIEDITDRCGLPTTRNATGALISGLARRGLIEWTGQMSASSRSERHTNLNRVWRGRQAA